MNKLILASKSEGRKKLLEYLKIPFEIIPSTLDEKKIIGRSPVDTLRLRARLKCEDVTSSPATAGLKFVLSADSGAILGNQLIGKPKDRKDAVRILSLLSGKTHLFATAVYIIKLQTNSSNNTTPGVLRSDSPGVLKAEIVLNGISKSFVTFRKLKGEEIDFYLSKTDYKRFAASYAIVSAQDFITEVKGSISNIIGLPLELLVPILKKLD